MPIKHWILSSINRINGVVGRPDLAPRGRTSTGAALREPSLHRTGDGREPGLPGPAHLGVYAPLIAAIRDELGHFVQSQLRLHLAIAERDRYLLTSIEVECVDGSDARDLLGRFVREFTPEQIKRFLARDVIAALPNAAAIDLSQFGGLNASRAHGDAESDAGEYADLVAQLRATAPGAAPRSFDVSLLGRWIDSTGARTPVKTGDAAPHTPLAGNRVDVEIQDAGGTRQLTLTAVVPNRRYTIGKGEQCDITVSGAFASRRHCEIWLEDGSWWASDAASTNGVRVESSKGVLGRSGAAARASVRAAIEIVPGARVVLSAFAEGSPADYPTVLLRQAERQATVATPMAPSAKAPRTPVTPIVAAASDVQPFAVTITMASGIRTVPLSNATLPLRIGRSRNQDLVVDWAHEGVSGQHIEVLRIIDSGVEIRVQGDNGVSVDGVAHAQGATFGWRCGERMTLGRASGREPECSLVLGRAA